MPLPFLLVGLRLKDSGQEVYESIIMSQKEKAVCEPSTYEKIVKITGPSSYGMICLAQYIFISTQDSTLFVDFSSGCF
jgi:hypothetical protein